MDLVLWFLRGIIYLSQRRAKSKGFSIFPFGGMYIYLYAI